MLPLLPQSPLPPQGLTTRRLAPASSSAVPSASVQQSQLPAVVTVPAEQMQGQMLRYCRRLPVVWHWLKSLADLKRSLGLL